LWQCLLLGGRSSTGSSSDPLAPHSRYHTLYTYHKHHHRHQHLYHRRQQQQDAIDDDVRHASVINSDAGVSLTSADGSRMLLMTLCVMLVSSTVTPACH